MKLRAVRERAAAAVVFSGILGLLWLAGACVPKPDVVPEPLPASRWGGRFHYTYSGLSGVGGRSIAATVAVVNPFFREPDSVLADPRFSPVGRGFSESLGVDMDKVLVSKGITVLGPFPAYDEITLGGLGQTEVTIEREVVEPVRTGATPTPTPTTPAQGPPAPRSSPNRGTTPAIRAAATTRATRRATSSPRRRD